jgi:hypothetical protein
VQEVDPLAVDLGGELRVAVELLLDGPPVEARAPVLGQLLQVGERNTALPTETGQLGRPPGVRQPLAKIVQLNLGNVDLERFHGGPSFVPKATGDQPRNVCVDHLRCRFRHQLLLCLVTAHA